MLNLKKIVPKWSILVKKNSLLDFVFENYFWGRVEWFHAFSERSSRRNDNHAVEQPYGRWQKYTTHAKSANWYVPPSRLPATTRTTKCISFSTALPVVWRICYWTTRGAESALTRRWIRRWRTSLTALVMITRFDCYAWALFCLTFTTSTEAMIPTRL